MANGYYAPFYRGGYFNVTPPAPQMPDASAQYQQQMPPYGMQGTAPTSDLIWVLNENEASSYPVMPGNTVTLWDKNTPTIYIKSVNAQGVPSMEILDFKKRPQNAPQVPQSAFDSGEGKYAAAEAFASLRAEFDELRAKVDSLGTKNTKLKESEDTDNG